jgi:hypothetical protein
MTKSLYAPDERGATLREQHTARRRRATIANQRGERVLEAVTIREIGRIFEVTDRLGIHRESLVIPLLPRQGGRVRRLTSGKLEIVVDAATDFEVWLERLEPELRKLTG